MTLNTDHLAQTCGCPAAPSLPWHCPHCQDTGICRYVLRGCGYEPVPCEADDPRAERCRECDAEPMERCSGCGERHQLVAFASEGEGFCFECSALLLAFAMEAA